METRARSGDGSATNLFRAGSLTTVALANMLPSSSPAFGTLPTILPVLLPSATLRPLAFRIFTKKHSLTLTSSALQSLADLIGKHCGSEWRNGGLAEKVLDEAARTWKREGGAVIVEGDRFSDILRSLEGSMSGGKLVQRGEFSRQPSLVVHDSCLNESNTEIPQRPADLIRDDSQASIGLSSLGFEEEDATALNDDPLHYLKVVDAFEQPQLKYVASKKQFEKIQTAPSLFPDSSNKVHLFRNRYNLIYQRLLRNESFHTPAISITRNASLQRSDSMNITTQQAYKITPIANLLGRSGTSHLLLGLLTISPTGTLALSDPTASITLDLRSARPIPEDGAWFSPGMVVLVDGIYEEGSGIETVLGGGGGVGGAIGGRFIGMSVGGPPCEKREVTLGISLADGGAGETSAGGGFGWVDFLGVGSERGVGSKMRRLERDLLRHNLDDDASSSRATAVFIGEVHLDEAKSMRALKKILASYTSKEATEVPMTFILVGNFVKNAVMAGGGSGDSIEYKECFNSLASVLSEFPSILQTSTFVFVPGDNDPWASAFSAGAATVVPRKGVPDIFTSRIRRAFTTAIAQSEKTKGSKASGEAIWTSNPARITSFGPIHEIVVFRDDMSDRLHRTAIRFQPREDPANGITNEAAPYGNGTSEHGGIDGENGLSSMKIDENVAAAESHVPASKGKATHGSSESSNLAIARKLVKTILDQGFLSPFPLTTRPVLWDFATALQLYPLPTALVLVDPGAPPFAVTYEGCHVMNPGSVIVKGRRGVARWMEYDISTRKGKIREAPF